MTHQSSATSPKRTVELLLEIESHCDEYEELLQTGYVISPEEYLARLNPELQAHLEPHLDRIFVAVDSTKTSTAISDILPRHVESCSFQPGQTLDQRFRLERFVGRGGTAVVWKAFDLKQEQFVAIKIAHTLSATIQARFEREEASSRQLDHPAIPKILHSGEIDDFPYLVLDFIDGHSLAEILKSRTLSIREAVRITRDICQIVAHAHSQSIVHRDLKPQNVLLDESGKLHVTDFGLARATEDECKTLTETGEVIGTLAYMPPEQAKGNGKEADQTADVYAIGMLLYQLLIGDTPFRGNAQHVLHQIMHVEPPPLRAIAAHIPEQIDWLVGRCLEKTPRHRFPHLEPVIANLDRYLAGEKLQIRRPSKAFKLWKWALKNQTLAASVSFVILLLFSVAAFCAVTAFMLNGAYQQEVRSRKAVEKANGAANAAVLVAREEAKQSQRVEQILVSLFEANDLVSVATQEGVDQASNIDLGQVLQRGIKKIRNDTDLSTTSKTRLLDVLGNISRLLGNLGDAKDLFAEADALREKLPLADVSDTQQFYALRGDLYRAHLLRDVGNEAEAVNAYSRIAQAALALPGQFSWLAAEAKLFEGQLHLQLRDTDAGMQKITESLQLQSRLQTIGDLQTYAKLLLATGSGSLSKLPMPEQLTGTWIGNLYDRFVAVEKSLDRKRYEPAIEDYRQALSMLRENLNNDESRWIALARGQFAGVLFDGGHYAEAFDVITELLDRYQDEAPNNSYIRQAQLRLAEELLRGGEAEKAQHYLNKYRRGLSNLADASDDYLLAQLWSSFAANNHDELLQISKLLIARSDSRTAHQSAWFRYAHARVLGALDREEEARDYDAQAIEIARSLKIPSKMPASWLERVSVILAHNQDLDQACELLRKAIAVETDKRFAEHPRVARYRASLAANLKRLGKYELALKQLTIVDQIWRQSLPPDSKLIKQCTDEILWLTNKLDP